MSSIEKHAELLLSEMTKTLKGETSPDAARAAATVAKQSISFIRAKLEYAKARGERPHIPLLETNDAATA